VAGNFLLDSESRIRTAAMGISIPETDPVCGMVVDQPKASAAGRAVSHHGRTYFFCSDTCKKQFEANPPRYAEKDPPPTRAPGRAADGQALPAIRPAGNDAAQELAETGGRGILSEIEPGIPPVATGRSIFRTDPVCGAEVEITAPDVLKLVHNGTTYYFLTSECRAEFEKNPEKYAGKGEQQPAATADTPEKAPVGAAARYVTTAPVTLPANPLGPTAADRRPGYHARPGVPRAAQPGQPLAGPTPPAEARPPGAPPAGGLAALERKDPVCGMDVEPKKAEAANLRSDYKGRTHYFCSDECKRKFDKEPEKYLDKKRPAGTIAAAAPPPPRVGPLDTASPGTGAWVGGR
jgi:YHS domain-containing protein